MEAKRCCQRRLSREMVTILASAPPWTTLTSKLAAYGALLHASGVARTNRGNTIVGCYCGPKLCLRGEWFGALRADVDVATFPCASITPMGFNDGVGLRREGSGAESRGSLD